MNQAYRVISDGSLIALTYGGWAALVIHPDGHEQLISGQLKANTTVVVELTALIEGLKLVPLKSAVVITVDNQEVMNSFYNKKIENWKNNGWKASPNGALVAHKGLWEQLDNLISDLGHISWNWVQSHSGHPENERVDIEARAQATQMQKQVETKKFEINQERKALNAEAKENARTAHVLCTGCKSSISSGIRGTLAFMNGTPILETGAYCVGCFERKLPKKKTMIGRAVKSVVKKMNELTANL